VQLDQNRQTQRLPQSAEGRQRLVRALGFAEDEGGLLDALEGHCGLVHKHFLALFEASQEGELEGERPVLLANAAERVASRWQRSAATPADGSWERLRACLEHFAPGVRETVFEVLEPYATEEGVGAEVADKIFVRLERYFSQARRRPGLVRLLNSAAAWLNGLSHALIRSGLVADLLSHQPSLVEGLVLTPGEGEEVGTAWREPAEAILASLSDFESALEWIRRLKNERLLQIALADLAGSLDASGVERALSDLAEFVIGRTFHLVRNERGLPGDLPLAVLALGKLGSREMNYLSDLDLVFVYHATDAEESGQIPTEVVRFIQRFMRLLSTPLQEGPGYAVDTRLRPTGNYGPLAVTRQSWFDYYTHRADVWELQALLRGRAIAGPETLCRWLEAGAQAVCYQARDPVTVWRRLCHLRARMQHERAEESEYLADIKLGAGSIADIEFLVQGQQLLQGHARPELRTTSIRAALRGLQESDAATDPWREALTLFEGLRALEQRLQLHTNLSAMGVAPGHLATMRELGLWPPPHGPTGLEDWHDLLRWRRRVQQIFRRWCAPG
jgi:glutamate-ammonia-ligase adenylyltransferase